MNTPATEAAKDLIGFLDFYLVQEGAVPDSGWRPRDDREVRAMDHGRAADFDPPDSAGGARLGAVFIPFGGVGYASGFGVLTIFIIIEIGLMIAALPGLFARKMAGWRLLFYSQLISIVYNVLSGSIVGGLLFGLIGLYILFQVADRCYHDRMKAIVVKPGVEGSIHMRDMPDPKLKPDQVAVKMIRAGLCRTDAEIGHGLFGQAPTGDEYLILGHENFGVVEEVGRKVKGFKAGDLVVATVRRPCRCYTCKAGQNDMCYDGAYQERGILGRHGFMAEYYVESPQWLNKIPRSVARHWRTARADVGRREGHRSRVSASAASGVEAQTGLVLGAGPIGLLAAAVMRTRGLDTHVVGREPETDRRAHAGEKDGRDVSLRGQEDAVRREEGDTARSTLRSKRPALRAWRSTACRFSGTTACCACSA